MNTAFQALARLVVDHRWVAAVLVGTFIAAVSSGALFVVVDFSASAFFADDSPELSFFQEHRERWGTDDTVLLIASSADDQDGVLTKERLDELAIFHAEIAALDVTLEVMGLPTAPRLERGAFGAVLPVPLRATVPADPERRRVWRQHLLDDFLLVPGLLSPDGQHSATMVNLGVDPDDVRAVQAAVQAVEVVVEDHQGDSGMHHALAGIPAVRAGLMDLVIREQSLFMSMAMVLMAILLYGMFRRVHGVVVPVIAAGIPMIMVFGLMGWTGQPIGLINQILATLVPVIAVADAIHMVSRFHEEQLARGSVGSVLSRKDHNEAVVAAMTRVGPACLLTTLTTMVGFISLYLAQMPVLRNFGLYAAAGIAFSWVTVVILVPLCLTVSRGPVQAATGSAGHGLGDRLLNGCASLAIRRPLRVIAGFAVLLAASAVYGNQVVVNNRLTSVLDSEHPISKGNATFDAHLGGLMAVEVGLFGDDLMSPESLTAMFETAQLVKRRGEVRAVLDPGSIVAGAAGMLGGEARVPTSASVTGRLVEALPMERLSKGGHARMIIRTKDVGANDFTTLSPALQSDLDEVLVPAGIEPIQTGLTVIAYPGINNITQDLRRSLGTAFVVVALLITLLFRSLRTGLVSLIPNAAPLAVGYGMIGWMGWELEPGTAVVFTVALGIAVDDTIHLLARYREERVVHPDHEALRLSVLHTGRAVAVTTVMLVAGFGINAFSTFPLNQVFGSLGAVIMFTALLCDLLLLPALLSLVSRRPQLA